MTEWWYLINEERFGPVSEDELVSLYSSSKIDDNTLVWAKGELGWAKLSEKSIFSNFVNLMPPPIPRIEKTEIIKASHAGDISSATSDGKAKTFPRILARFFDLLLASIPCFFIFLFAIGELALHPEIKPNIAYYIAFIVLFSVLTFLIDSFIYSVFGNTLFKSILKIKVTNKQDITISRAQYFKRNFKVLTYGFCLGIPLLSTIANIIQAVKISKSGLASYDTDTKVIEDKRSAFSWIIFLVLAIILLVMNGLVTTIQTQNYDAQLQNKFQNTSTPTFTWVNPKTGKTLSVDDRWKVQEKDQENGKLIYFVDSKSKMYIILNISTKPVKKIDELRFNMINKAGFNAINESEIKTVIDNPDTSTWDASGNFPGINNQLVLLKMIASPRANGYIMLPDDFQNGAYQFDDMDRFARQLLIGGIVGTF